MDKIVNQFFGNGTVMKSDYNFNPHRPINNPEVARSAHVRKSTFDSNNPMNNSELLRSSAQKILNPEEKNQIDIMNLKINNLQHQQEKENKELLDVIKKSIDYKNNFINGQNMGMGLPQNPMSVMSSIRPVNYGNIPQHPAFNPFYMPMIPQANRYNEYAVDTPPVKKRRHKSMELEELNENIELMQEELNKNISKIIFVMKI